VAMVTQVYKKAAQGGVSQEEISDMLKFFSRGGSCNGYFDGCTYKKMMDDGTKTKISQVLPDLPKREKKMPVSQYLVAKNGEPLTLTMLSKQGESVSVTGAICEQAHTVPTSKERLKEQLEKLGETAFYADYTEVTASPDVAVPIKEINALRRQAAEALSQNITSAYKRNLPPITVAGRQNLPHTNHRVKLCAQVHSLAQLQAAVSRGIERIYLPEKLWSYSHLVQEPVLQMPPLLRECEAGPKVEFSAACVQNIGQLASCWQKDVTAGHRMNITNSQTVELLQNEGVSHFVLSPELNMGAIRAIRQQTKATLEVIAYGRIPLMLLENCVIRNSVGCRCEEAQFALRDRKNEILPILPLHCGNEVYNAKPILMADRLQELTDLGIDSLRLLFTVEDEATTRAIIRLYQEAMAGAEIMAPQFDFTRGHYYRGMQ